jgi:Zn finger protein HypA/HybF involved in hydrogenase expression
MHEFALIQDLIEKTLAEMKAKEANKVTLIELSVGNSSGYSTESLKQAYELLVADTDFKDAELVLETVEGRDVIIKRIMMEQ